MKKRTSSLLILLLSVLMAVSISAEEAFDWNALEKSYNEGTSPFVSDSQLLSRNQDTLDSQVDYSIAVERFRIRYDLLNPNATGEKEQFAAEFNKGTTLMRMAESTGRFYAPYMDEEGIGTAMVKDDGTFIQAFSGDKGKAYKLELTGGLKKQLSSSSLSPKYTKLYNIYLPDICSGVLFTDGVSEYYYVELSDFKSIREGTLYAAADLVDAIVKEENIKPAPPVVLTYDENGELIPPDTGMGGPEDEASPFEFNWLIVPVVLGALLFAAGLIVLIKKRTAKR